MDGFLPVLPECPENLDIGVAKIVVGFADLGIISRGAVEVDIQHCPVHTGHDQDRVQCPKRLEHVSQSLVILFHVVSGVVRGTRVIQDVNVVALHTFDQVLQHYGVDDRHVVEREIVLRLAAAEPGDPFRATFGQTERCHGFAAAGLPEHGKNHVLVVSRTHAPGEHLGEGTKRHLIIGITIRVAAERGIPVGNLVPLQRGWFGLGIQGVNSLCRASVHYRHLCRPPLLDPASSAG